MAPGIMRRLACLPYEALLLLALVLIASFPVAGLKGMTLGGLPHFLYQAYLAAVVGLYFVWQWQANGQTLPMKTWRLKLVSRSGSRITWQRGLLRFFWAAVCYGPACAAVFMLFFPRRLSPALTIWLFLPMLASWLHACFDRDGQFLHDRLAGTMLIDAPRA